MEKEEGTGAQEPDKNSTRYALSRHFFRSVLEEDASSFFYGMDSRAVADVWGRARKSLREKSMDSIRRVRQGRRNRAAPCTSSTRGTAGPIIFQKKVPILAEEHRAYPEAIAKVLASFGRARMSLH